MDVGIITYGCSANRADSERIAGLLSAAGHNVILGSEEPDFIILNSCIVKGPTENKILRKLSDLNDADKKVIIAGCLPGAYPKLLSRFPNFAAIATNTDDILEVFDALLNGNVIHILREESKAKTCTPLRHNKHIGVISISQGCLGNCTYCATCLARGTLRSKSPDEIVSEVRDAVESGCSEIWLTSQDNGCYGADIGSNLPDLMNSVANVPGDFRVRIGMMNPAHTKKIKDELGDAFRNEKLYKFAHIPLQSGSDKVLSEMRRGGSASDFKGIVNLLRKKNPGITIATDIIVGYPTETEDDFQKTVDLIEELRPEVINLSKYWPRKGTDGANLKQLPRDVISSRSAELARMHSIMIKEDNKRWNGKICEVFVTGIKNSSLVVGRNEQYRPVLINNRNCLGQKVSVKIVDTKSRELIGEVLD